jgi:transposase
MGRKRKLADEDQKMTVELLREILKWTKVTSIPEVKAVLLATLKTPEQRKAYQASNGRKLAEVAAMANAGVSTVGKWWDSWAKLGIAEMRPAQGGSRAFRSFSLEDFEIEVS